MQTDNKLMRETKAEEEEVCIFLFIEVQTILSMCWVKDNYY